MENMAYNMNGPEDGKSSDDVTVNVGGEKNSTLDGGFEKTEKPATKPADKPYAGMGKEDLMRFSDTPFWNRFRMACLIIFWVAWLALLVAVIVMTIIFPRCTAPPKQSWWQKSVFYQVYVRSYFDSDGDGVGDLNGITEKIDHLKAINVDALILSSIYPSEVDYGYDVTDHTDIDPDYGTLADFETLLEAAHNNSMKVLLDFIPNHTSDKHPWFNQSQDNPGIDNQYWNYYVWQDCGGGGTPDVNNWMSAYSQPMWTRANSNSSRANQCYLHQFLIQEPDLNLRSSRVQDELEQILRYWLEIGVDGFRVNSAYNLYEDADLQNESLIEGCTNASNTACYNHTYTKNQPESHGIVASWRAVVEEYSTADNPKILLTDALGYDVTVSTDFYGVYGAEEANFPMNFQLTSLSQTCDGTCVKQLVDGWLDNMPSGKTGDWLTDYQDMGRMASVLDTRQLLNCANMLKFTLPGTTVTFYGEEIGMVNGDITGSEIKDPAGKINPEYSRDDYRTPMQWSGEANAGFSTHKPWLPVNSDYPTRNVAEQNNDTESTMQMFSSLADLHRTQNSLHYGNFEWVYHDENVVSYLREYEGDDRILVAINFGQADSTVNLEQGSSMVPGSADVLQVTSTNMSLKPGDSAKLSDLMLAPGDGAVFTWPYTR